MPLKTFGYLKLVKPENYLVIKAMNVNLIKMASRNTLHWIRRVEPLWLIQPILLVAPPQIQEAKGKIAPKFQGAETKAVGLASAIGAVAQEFDCHFFDAGSVATTSSVDGVHLDEDQHLTLGKVLAAEIKMILHNVAA